MDQTVNTAASQIKTVPHQAVSIQPKSWPSYNRKGMATICTVVLILPTMCTATLLEAPNWAIHSRKAEIAISRPMMISATKTLTRCKDTNIKSEAQTKNLSATGSKKAPKAEA